MTEPVNLLEFEAAAKPKLPQMAYDYFAGGASDQVTLQDNREAFNRIKLMPRMLRDVSHVDVSTELFGQRLASPVLIAPMGFLGLAHPDCELAIMRAATETQIGMILSTMASTTLEDVAQAGNAPLWFQLYIYKNREVTRRLVERAEAAGYTALVLTVDTPILGRREADIRNQWHLPPHVQVKNLMGSGMEGIVMDDAGSGLAAYIATLWDPSIAWQDIEWLQSITKLPIIVKGIVRADDAQLALEHGAAGIIVSNHGGRQVDTTPAAIDTLPAIVDVVAGQATVILDGGIRRGTDIIKALALGADAVSVGRPVIWGLAYAGQAGVQKVLTILQTEFENAMALCGCRNLEEVTPDLLWFP